MERFLQYSRDHERAIRLIALLDGGMKQLTAVVEAYDDASVSLRTLRPKKELTLPRADVLSADYRKGDEGMD